MSQYAIMPELNKESVAVPPTGKRRKRKLLHVWLACWLMLFTIAGAGEFAKWKMNAQPTKAQYESSSSILAMWHVSLPLVQWIKLAMTETQHDKLQKPPFMTSRYSFNSSSSPLPTPPASVMLRVPALSQEPALQNGCEVTSLAMLLQFTGHNVSKETLADTIAKDPTPEQTNGNGTVVAWGSPNRGFVGDIKTLGAGYGVYHGPIVSLLDRYWPGHGVDLTGQSFNTIMSSLQEGHPVIAWTTLGFKPTKNWMTWMSESGIVKATWDEHTVVIVGYDANDLYVNDPADGASAKRVTRDAFIASWEQLGSQAVTYR